MVRLMTNPLILRSLLVLFIASAAFALAVWLMRALRQRLSAEANLDSSACGRLEALPLHVYNTVIQQLKQQKHELQVQNQAEQRRARTSENFSQAVLSNLSSGVLVFGLNGLVKQANPAAKQMLGFSSPSGMSAEDIFRGALVCSGDASVNRVRNVDAYSTLADEVNAVLREGSKCRQLEAEYTSPAGRTLRVAVTVSPVPAVDGSLLGAACLISDRTDFERIRQQQQVEVQISAEMALELRTSLATISGYARRLSGNQDQESASQLAGHIAAEAARLERHIGGFLTRYAGSPATVAPASAKSANRGQG
jgi:nitrogen fixation/metabolism regulation signal transduction histidine kinase